MKTSELVKKLVEEMAVYGDIPILVDGINVADVNLEHCFLGRERAIIIKSKPITQRNPMIGSEVFEPKVTHTNTDDYDIQNPYLMASGMTDELYD